MRTIRIETEQWSMTLADNVTVEMLGMSHSKSLQQVVDFIIGQKEFPFEAPRKMEAFKIPTKDEAIREAIDKGLTHEEAVLAAEGFINFYASNGWKVGRNPMKSWRHALAGWILRSDAQPKANGVVRKPFISELNTVLSAKKELLTKIYNRGNDEPLGWRARNPEDAAAYKQLKREINQLQEQIAKSL